MANDRYWPGVSAGINIIILRWIKAGPAPGPVPVRSHGALWLLTFDFWLLTFDFWLLTFAHGDSIGVDFWLLTFGFWLLTFDFWPMGTPFKPMGSPWGAHGALFHKIDFSEFSVFFQNRAPELKIRPQGYFCMPDRSGTVPASPEPPNKPKIRFFEKSKKIKKW